tara:strand:+ start:303 stop:539 length:237 start_codon:yes stop_codon:yes gene_type:complete
MKAPKIPSLFKTKKPKSFKFNPRYYNINKNKKIRKHFNKINASYNIDNSNKKKKKARIYKIIILIIILYLLIYKLLIS